MSDKSAEHQTELNVVRQAPVALPTTESERAMAVRRTEWRSIRTRMERFADPLANAGSWSSTFLGIAITSLLTLVAFPAATQKLAPWTIPLYAVITICAFFLTGFCFWVDRKMRSSRTDEVQSLCQEMDEIERRYQ